MLKDPTSVTATCARFVVAFYKTNGRMPTNAEITEGIDVMPWRVASVMTALVEKGVLRRRQVRSQGRPGLPKYEYALDNEARKFVR
jgi:predicted transcriptional regulator